MSALTILTGAITGTSIMTAFSYIISYYRRRNFREPELLNELLVRLRILEFRSSPRHPAGWLIHYGVGLLFTISYAFIVTYFQILPTLGFYILCGGASGLVGIFGWHVTLKLHPNPPPIHLREYYIQLWPAHVLFGVGAYLGYLLVGWLG